MLKDNPKTLNDHQDKTFQLSESDRLRWNELLDGEFIVPEKEVESYVDAYGIRRCSKTLMPMDSDGVGVVFKNIRDTVA